AISLVLSNPSFTFFDKNLQNRKHWPFFPLYETSSRAINAHRTCSLRVVVVHGHPAFRQRVSGNPDALGTSRVIAVSPTEYPRVHDEGHSIGTHTALHGVLKHLPERPRPGWSVGRP